MRPAVVLVLCALPLSGGCPRNPQADAAGPGARDLAQFEEVVRQTGRERAHTAVALAAGPEHIGWGTAVAAPSPERAKALALARCTMHARLRGVGAPCSLYAIDGRPLYLEAR